MKKYTIYDFSSDPGYVRPYVLYVDMGGRMAFLRTDDTLRSLFQWDEATACVEICRQPDDVNCIIASEEDWVMEILKA